MKVMSHRFAIISAAATLLALGGCVTPGSDVRVDKADVDLSKCRTFDWRPSTSDAASFTEQRVRAAALQQLQEKGYAISADKPDCQITYVLDTQDRPKPKPSVGVGAGGGSGGVHGGVGVSLPIGRHKEQVGSFTLDVVDVAQQAQIWSGSLDVGFRAGEISEQDANEAVRTILAKFPDHAAQ
jgi:uncharacterized protein DUF4136